MPFLLGKQPKNQNQNHFRKVSQLFFAVVTSSVLMGCGLSLPNLKLPNLFAQVNSSVQSLNATPTSNDSTGLTADCQLLGFYSTLNECKDNTYASCLAVSSAVAGGTLVCFKPVNNWELCANPYPFWQKHIQSTSCSSIVDGYTRINWNRDPVCNLNSPPGVTRAQCDCAPVEKKQFCVVPASGIAPNQPVDYAAYAMANRIPVCVGYSVLPAACSNSINPTPTPVPPTPTPVPGVLTLNNNASSLNNYGSMGYNNTTGISKNFLLEYASGQSNATISSIAVTSAPSGCFVYPSSGSGTCAIGATLNSQNPSCGITVKMMNPSGNTAALSCTATINVQFQNTNGTQTISRVGLNGQITTATNTNSNTTGQLQLIYTAQPYIVSSEAAPLYTNFTVTIKNNSSDILLVNGSPTFTGGTGFSFQPGGGVGGSIPAGQPCNGVGSGWTANQQQTINLRYTGQTTVQNVNLTINYKKCDPTNPNVPIQQLVIQLRGTTSGGANIPDNE